MSTDKRNLMVMVLSLMAFLANGDNYAVAPLLINIAKDLKIDIGSAALSVTAYMLAFGLFTIIFGPLGDRYGKTRIINVAAFGTAIFSMLGAFAKVYRCGSIKVETAVQLFKEGKLEELTQAGPAHAGMGMGAGRGFRGGR